MKKTKVVWILVVVTVIAIFSLFIYLINREEDQPPTNIQIKDVNMLDLYSSRNVGYPNCMGCFCYLNSALQLLRTVVYPFKKQLNPVVAHFLQIVNKCDPILNRLFLYYVAQENVGIKNKLEQLYIAHSTGEKHPQVTEELAALKDDPNFSTGEGQYFGTSNFILSDAHEFLSHVLNACVLSDKDNFLDFFKIRTINYLEYTDPTTNKNVKRSSGITDELIYSTSIDEYRNMSIISLRKLVQDIFNPKEEQISLKINEIPTEVTKLTYLNPSEYILLSFKLFTNDAKVIPLKIALYDYLFISTVVPDGMLINRYKYKPISIVCYVGKESTGGHYINYSKRLTERKQQITNGTWYKYDDSDAVQLGGNIQTVEDDIKKIPNAVPYIIALKRVRPKNKKE